MGGPLVLGNANQQPRLNRLGGREEGGREEGWWEWEGVACSASPILPLIVQNGVGENQNFARNGAKSRSFCNCKS